MANRFWVGGSGTWNGSATTHWSTTSGGSNGASAPTATDDVIFDASSGTGTVTMGAAKCKSLDASTTSILTWSFVNNSCTVSGDVTFKAGLTFTGNYAVVCKGTGSQLFTSGGNTIRSLSIDATSAGKYTIQDNLSVSNLFTISSGSFDANNHDISTGCFNISNSTSLTVTMGSGTWTLTGDNGTYTDIWTIGPNPSFVTIVPNTSTIKFTNSSSATKNFLGAGKTYNNIWFTGTGTGQYNISDSNTFNDFKDDNSATHTLNFIHGTTQTVTSWTVSGSAGHPITLSSDTTSAFTLSKSSGTVTSDYLNISYSTATGGATWNAGNNSIDNGNNTGWNFFVPTYKLTVAVGTFILTGISSLFSRGRSLVTAVTAFTLTGVSILAHCGRNITVTVGSFSLSGISIITSFGRHMITLVSTFSLTGINSSFVYGRRIITNVGSFTLTGINSSFVKVLRVITTVASFSLTGLPIKIKGRGTWLIRNVARPTSSMINTIKVSSGETWASITSTWATETRTWLDVSQLLKNTTRQSSSITNQDKP